MMTYRYSLENDKITDDDILFFKALELPIDEKWIDWSYQKLIDGYETDNLLMLAAERKPFNQTELKRLTEIVLNELKIDFSDPNKVIKKILLKELMKMKIDKSRTLEILKFLKDFNKVYYTDCLWDIDALYWAIIDLETHEFTGYLEGVHKNEIDKVIENYLVSWQKELEKT